MPYKPYRNEETRSSILSGVKAGSEAAWSRFFDLYAGYVFALARRGGLSAHDADDLVQTVFTELAAPDGFDGYERGKGAFRPWLRRRVQWRIADALRGKTANSNVVNATTEELDTLEAHSASLDESWIEAARDEALRRLQASSSSEHFAIFQASVMEELPTEDVMALYKVTRASLYQIRRRMKTAFEACLKAALEDLDAPLPPQ